MEMSVIPTARARCISRIRPQYSASLLVVRPTYLQSRARVVFPSVSLTMHPAAAGPGFPLHAPSKNK